MTGPRVQSGFRLEKRPLNVLKALAALWDLSVGDIVENIIRAGLVAG